MAKFIKQLFFLYLAALCALPIGNREAFAADFFGDLNRHVETILASHKEGWKTFHSHNAYIDNPGPEDMLYTKVFRSPKTLIVLGDMDYGNKAPRYLAWFSTKDASLSFGAVKVGGNIRSAIESKAIDLPEMEEGKTEDGVAYYSWTDGVDTDVTIVINGDVIEEISFINWSTPVGIDAVGKLWEKLDYLP